MQGSGKSGILLTELFLLLLKFIPFLFYLVALRSPNQGFITKQVGPIHTDKWGDGMENRDGF